MAGETTAHTKNIHKNKGHLAKVPVRLRSGPKRSISFECRGLPTDPRKSLWFGLAELTRLLLGLR